MPVSVVNIDLTADIAARQQETFTDVAVIGTAEAAPPNAEIGAVNRYASAAEVSNDYGEDTDVHVASEAIEAMGAQHWYVLVLQETSVEAEDVDDGAAAANTPILGEAGVTAAARDVVYSTESPPAAPGDGEVAVNTDTGEVATDDGTAATLDYTYVEWADLDHLLDEDINLVGFADVQAQEQHIGQLDELAGWADEHGLGVVFAHMDGRNAASDQDALETAHAVGGYVPSGDILSAAHKSDADVGGHILGQLATHNPWFDPYYDGEGYPFESESYPGKLIGDPATQETFEGGDNEGLGPTNVVIEVADTTVLSNSLTTAGPDSSYQYFDIGRTESFAATVIEEALRDLRLQEDRIPFDSDGRTMISSEIRSSLSEYVGGADAPFASLDLYVPPFDELTEEERADRVWTGIEVQGRLAGNVHEFSFKMTVTV